MHRFFISIILSDHKMSMSSLSGSLDMFIISCCLIKRSLQTLESENNYTFTQRWSGWGEKQINYLKSKQKKKSSVFKPCVINLLMTKPKIHGTFIEIHYSMTSKNGEDFSWPFKRSSGLWSNAWKNAPKTIWTFFVLIANSFRVSIS